MSDADINLLQKWHDDRDAHAFSEIVTRHSDMVYATCRRILRNDTLAEDVAQQCFIVLSTCGRGVRISVGAWLHTVATRSSLNLLRTEGRRRKREVEFAARALEATEPTWDDIQEHVDLAIEEQPEKVRRVLVAHFFGQQSQQAICEALDIPRRTVGYLLDRGVQGIRRSLRRKGILVPLVAVSSLIRLNNATAAPTTLVVSLGKLAMAGTAGGTAVTATSAACTTAMAIGGACLVKKIIVSIVALALGVLAVWSISGTKERAELSQNVASNPERLGPGAEKAATLDLTSDVQETDPAPSGLVPNAVEPKGTDEIDSTSAPRFESDLATASVAGRVYDVQTNAGVPGVKVIGQKSDGIDVTMIVQETDSTGHYSIEGLDEGNYTISCSALPQTYTLSEECSVKAVDLRASTKVTGIDLGIERAGNLEGTVTKNGSVVANALLMTDHYVSNGEPRSLEIQTDAEGRYRISGLEKGGRRVTFTLLRGESRSIHRKMPVIIAPGATTVADVEFQSGSASIEGVVYQDENTPLEAHVEAHFHNSGFMFGTKCDANGFYQLEGLPAEPVEMLVYMDAKPDAPIRRRAVKLELADDETVRQDICLSGTTLTCKVTNLPDDSAVAFIVALAGEVDLSDKSFEALYLAMQRRESFSVLPPGGIGEITALKPGTYTVLAASTPADPSVVEALEGEALQEFMSKVEITSSVLVTIEEYGQSLAVDLRF